MNGTQRSQICTGTNVHAVLNKLFYAVNFYFWEKVIKEKDVANRILPLELYKIVPHLRYLNICIFNTHFHSHAISFSLK